MIVLKMSFTVKFSKQILALAQAGWLARLGDWWAVAEEKAREADWPQDNLKFK